jgi:hypothetical protein
MKGSTTMDYKNMPLYQRLSRITGGIKENLKNIAEFRKENLQEFKKVLVGRGSLYNKEPVGTEFDFVVFRKPGFVWSEQKHKDDILLVAKVIFKTSTESLKSEIETELFKLHSVQALRKLLIIVNTADEKNKGEYLIPYFIKNYELFLNFPPYLSSEINLEKCPMCGTTPSRIEPWFYNEETDELLPVAEYIDEPTYFKF